MTDGDPASLDPIRSVDVAYFHFWDNVYSQLVQYNWQDPKDKIMPDLAESWTVSNDLKTYTFKLRQGVTWQDGKPFTAENAKWMVDIKKKEGGWMVSELATVDKVEAVDQTTLRITLSKGRSSFMQVLALNLFPFAAQHVNDAAKGDLKTGPNIGTGPFKESKFQRGVVLELARNPNYYDPALPYLDGIKFQYITDAGTYAAAFRAGKLDFIGLGTTAVDRDVLETLKKSVPNLQPNPHDSMEQAAIKINTKVKPWDDVRVRRAAFLAIDRGAAMKGLSAFALKPAAAPVTLTWSLPDQELYSIPGYRKGDDLEADRETARKLLVAAGYPNGFDTEIITLAGIPKLMKPQVFIIDQLSQIGIRTRSTAYDGFAVFMKRGLDWDYPLMSATSVIAYPSPDASAVFVQESSFNNNLLDPQTIDLFQKQGLEPDPAKQRELVYAMQRRMIEMAPFVPIVWLADYYPAQPWVGGLAPALGLRGHTNLDHVWVVPHG